MEDQGIKVIIDDSVKSYLVKNGYDPEYGARPVQRFIRREILAGLSKYLLQYPEIKQVHNDIKKSRESILEIASILTDGIVEEQED